MKSRVRFEKIFYQSNIVRYTEFASPIADIESEMSEILQEHLGNLIRGKEGIKIENLRTVCKSYLETHWKSNKKFVWDKNSVLEVD